MHLRLFKCRLPIPQIYGFHCIFMSNIKIPVARSPKQLYVFFSLESPINDNIDGFSEE